MEAIENITSIMSTKVEEINEEIQAVSRKVETLALLREQLIAALALLSDTPTPTKTNPVLSPGRNPRKKGRSFVPDIINFISGLPPGTTARAGEVARAIAPALKKANETWPSFLGTVTSCMYMMTRSKTPRLIRRGIGRYTIHPKAKLAVNE